MKRREEDEAIATCCRECGSKLSIFQLLSNALFCTESHRKLHEAKYQQKMLGRLLKAA